MKNYVKYYTSTYLCNKLIILNKNLVVSKILPIFAHEITITIVFMETTKRSRKEILEALRNLQKQKEAFEERADRKIEQMMLAEMEVTA